MVIWSPGERVNILSWGRVYFVSVLACLEAIAGNADRERSRLPFRPDSDPWLKGSKGPPFLKDPGCKPRLESDKIGLISFREGRAYGSKGCRFVADA